MLSSSFTRLSLLTLTLGFALAGVAKNPSDCLNLDSAKACRDCLRDVCAEELRRIGDEVGEAEAKKAFDEARENASVDNSPQASERLDAARQNLELVRKARSTRFKSSACQVEGAKLEALCDKKR